MIYIISSERTNPADWTNAWTAAGIPFEEISAMSPLRRLGFPTQSSNMPFDCRTAPSAPTYSSSGSLPWRKTRVSIFERDHW